MKFAKVGKWSWLALLGFLLILSYGWLALSTVNLIKESRHDAHILVQERNAAGTKAFALSYQKTNGDLEKISKDMQNPLWSVLFFTLGSHETLTNMQRDLHAIQEIFQRLRPLANVTTQTVSNSDGINFHLLEVAAPYLESSSAAIKTLTTGIAQLHFHGLLTPFDSKLNRVRAEAKASATLATVALPIVPEVHSLLGAQRSMNYLIAFQNPAESRATGGILGAYAIASASQGHVNITRIGSNLDLHSLDQIPIPTPTEYQNLYGNDPAIWQNSNLSPHFPYAAQIWSALWRIQSGQTLDGVITMDPEVLAALLEVTGPIHINHEEINSQNVVQKTMSDAYIRFADNNLARKQYLVSIVAEVLRKITHEKFSFAEFILAIEKPVMENRILIFSNDSKVETALAKTQLAGVVEDNGFNVYRLAINNTAGNKMDYYLHRSISIKSLTCGSLPTTQVDYTVENTSSILMKLPPYVAGRLDLSLPKGLQNSSSIEGLLFGPAHSILLSAKLVGQDDVVGSLGFERNHPVLVTQLELKPGVPVHVQAVFQGGIGALQFFSQPLVHPIHESIVDHCTVTR